MKKILLLAGAMLALTAVVANAQINLSWTDCGTFGTLDKTFSCTSNLGSQSMYASYISPAGISGLSGAEGVFDLQSASAALPAWWSFGSGQCRPTQLSVAFNTPCADALDYWGSIPGGALGGFAYYVGFGGANRGRIKTVCAVDASQVQPLDGVSEYYALTLRIVNTLTTGTGACAGCTTPVCIVFNSLNLTQAVGVGDHMLSAPANSNFVTWQGGAGIGTGPYGGTGCPGATPTNASSWGHVKALYR